VLRGARHEGQRLIKALVDNNLPVEERAELAYVLHSNKSQGIHDMYKGIEKYILDKKGNLQELQKNTLSNKIVYTPEYKAYPVWYDEIRGGKALDKGEAMDKYPEWFV